MARPSRPLGGCPSPATLSAESSGEREKLVGKAKAAARWRRHQEDSATSQTGAPSSAWIMLVGCAMMAACLASEPGAVAEHQHVAGAGVGFRDLDQVAAGGFEQRLAALTLGPVARIGGGRFGFLRRTARDRRRAPGRRSRCRCRVRSPGGGRACRSRRGRGRRCRGGGAWGVSRRCHAEFAGRRVVPGPRANGDLRPPRSRLSA